jgi:alpha-1,2-mannosyltransferase
MASTIVVRSEHTDGRATRYSVGARIGLVVIALAVAAVPLIAGTGYFIGLDFGMYRATGAAILHGVSPYDFRLEHGLMFPYTPFAALLLVVVAITPANVALAWWTLLSVLALQWTIRVCLRAAGVASGRRLDRLTAGITLASIPLFPVILTLQVGQINIMLMALVVIDLLRRSDRWRGVGVGIAAGIKLTPLIFIAYLFLTRQVRTALVATGSFLATVAVGVLVLPQVSLAYWSGIFLDTSRMEALDQPKTWNQSLREIIILHTPTTAVAQVVYLVVAVVVGVLGLLVARSAYRQGEQLAAIVACGLTGLLISPISWAMHWVWVVPLFVLAAAGRLRGGPRRALIAPLLVFLAFFVESLPIWPMLFASPPLGVFAHVTVLAGLCALVVIARSRTRRTTPDQVTG